MVSDGSKADYVLEAQVKEKSAIKEVCKYLLKGSK
jgi:hypothetical protein